MKIIIEGAGEIGSHLAKMLSLEANDISVIDPDGKKLSKLRTVADVVTVQGNYSSIKSLKEAGVTGCDLFIAVNPGVSQDVNIVSALLAKSLGAGKVTARIDDEEYLTSENKLIFKQMGIELMFYPEKIAADEIIDLLKHTEATENMDFGRGKLQVSVFKLEENSPLIDMKLAEFAAAASHDDLQFRVIAVTRDGKTIIPRPDYKFQYHDLVFIISKREGMAEITRFLGMDNVEVNSAIIFGGTDMGRITAGLLSKRIGRVKILERDKDICHELSERLGKDVLVVNADAKNTDVLIEEGIRNCDAFLALTPNDEVNILSCVVAKKFGVERTIADVENLEYIRFAEEMGVDAVINKKLLTAGRIFKYTLSGKARMVKYMSGTDAEVLEYTAAPGSGITKAPLKDIDFPDNAIIGGVIRGGDSFIAIGSTRIEAYDRVAVFALSESVKAVDKLFK